MGQKSQKTFVGQPAGGVFFSGTGTNASHLLSDQSETPEPVWQARVVMTDRPETSAAREIARRFKLPLIEHDIFAFYRSRGLDGIQLGTPASYRVREEWTDELRRRLAPYHLDFVVFAGFFPLTGITADYPCLNIHPGDLTVEEEGERLLAGLNHIPIETAILRGHDSIRASVILAQPFSDGKPRMDAGPILGISPALPLDFGGASLDELRASADARAGKRRSEYAGDLLSTVAERNQIRLKEHGDWVILPQVVRHFAMRHYAFDGDRLYFMGEPVKTIEFFPNRTFRTIAP